MQKNKTVTNILLIVVPGLWLFFFYRIYTSFFAEDTKQAPTYEPITKKKVQLDQTEDFTIQANYPDPFAAKMATLHYSSSTEVTVRKPKAKAQKPKKEEVKTDWTFIRYIGLIKSPNYKKQVALIAINGKEHMVSEGDIIENVLVSKLMKDSIKVSYQKATTFIKK